MKRLFLICSAVAVAGGVAAAPAVAGLAGNSSFSHHIPVRVPSQASIPQIADDHGSDGIRLVVPTPNGGRDSHDGTPATGTDTPSAPGTEPGDDRGATTQPGDDRGATTEPGDDRGGSTTEPGEDVTTTSAPEPGDDNGGHSGSPSATVDNSGPGATSTGSDGGGHDGTGGGGHGSDG